MNMTSIKEKISFQVPTRDQVTENNQAVFDHMKKSFGRVPNLFATFALNETALRDYIALQNRKSTLSAKEREIINLVVSQVNNCRYRVPAHTAVSKMLVYFTDEQILEIRRADISFDTKLDSLAKFVKQVTVNRGRPSADAADALFDAGYDQANVIDIMMIIGDKIISNYVHNFTQIPVDWPEVPGIE